MRVAIPGGNNWVRMFFFFLRCGFHGLSSQNGGGGGNISLRKAKDLGGRSYIVPDDKGKMHLKGLVTYGGEERAAREPGHSGRK